MTLNACLQYDPYFELYSSVDERSAAYIAVGLAAESQEPVALSCTGATASRNYIPGLTEAYYRKLPVLAITATQRTGRVGQYCPQVIDRSSLPRDIAMESVLADVVMDEEDEWTCTLNINKALLALTRNGGGPAHINMVTTYNRDYSVKTLPDARSISLIDNIEAMPSLESYKHIAVLVGTHTKWSDRLYKAVEDFCEKYDAVVIKNHSSNYSGEYGYNPEIITMMAAYTPNVEKADLVIYIGSVSRYNSGMNEKEMWRVNPDGQIRDFERKTTCVFEMAETTFFEYYNGLKSERLDCSYAKAWQQECKTILEKTPELPFSNVWIAQQISSHIPERSVVHIAGSNTARAWNFFSLPSGTEVYSNDGEMGIDGQVSALIGESLAGPDRIHFGFVGDLTFFYDMNSIGNRYIKSNLRLLVVNNGIGAEFKIYSHPAYAFGDAANPYMAAGGHFGHQSRNLIRNYATDLGFEYLSADNKEEFLKQMEIFLDPEKRLKPILFEVFTDAANESEAIYTMNHLSSTLSGKGKEITKQMIKNIAGDKGVDAVKNLVHKIKG